MRYITKTCLVCVRSKHLSFLLKTESVTGRAAQGTSKKNHQKMPGIYQNLDFNSTKKHFIKCCKAGGFSLFLIIYLQQVYWECGRRGGVYICRGAPVLSQYYNELFQKKNKQAGGGV